MSEYMYLSGSEDVKSAAAQMTRAADEMSRAAAMIWESVDRLAQVLAEDRDARTSGGDR